MVKFTGRVFINANGLWLPNVIENSSLDIGGVKRETQVTGTGFGYTETLTPGVLEVTILHNSDINLQELQSIANGAGNFLTDTGKSFVLSGLTCLDSPKITGGKGEVALKFACEVREVTA